MVIQWKRSESKHLFCGCIILLLCIASSAAQLSIVILKILISFTHSNLIGKYGGTFIQYYVLRKFFTATLTQAQATSMASDSCTLAIEPNYIVRARGTSVTTLLGAANQELQDSQASSSRRNLGIPEFNKMDDNPPSWGLERISTRGRKNGKYIWVSEGFGTDVCKCQP